MEEVTTRRSLLGCCEHALAGELATNSDIAMVYVSVHGVVDQSGKPCLAPPDASPFGPEGDVGDPENRLAPRQRPLD